MELDDAIANGGSVRDSEADQAVPLIRASPGNVAIGDAVILPFSANF